MSSFLCVIINQHSAFLGFAHRKRDKNKDDIQKKENTFIPPTPQINRFVLSSARCDFRSQFDPSNINFPLFAVYIFFTNLNKKISKDRSANLKIVEYKLETPFLLTPTPRK